MSCVSAKWYLDLDCGYTQGDKQSVKQNVADDLVEGKGSNTPATIFLTLLTRVLC